MKFSIIEKSNNKKADKLPHYRGDQSCLNIFSKLPPVNILHLSDQSFGMSLNVRIDFGPKNCRLKTARICLICILTFRLRKLNKNFFHFNQELKQLPQQNLPSGKKGIDMKFE